MFKHQIRILFSLGIIAFLSGLVISGTTAVFVDVEIAESNFTAGFIDLQIGAECSFKIDNPSLLPGTNTCAGNSSFSATNVGPLYKFFDYGNLEPGDFGVNSIAVKPLASDAWGRLQFLNLENYDNLCTEPEILAEPGCVAQGTSTIFSGELQNNGNGTMTPVSRNMLFKLWLDEGTTPGFQCDGVRRCGADVAEGNGYRETSEPVLSTLNGVSGSAHFTEGQTINTSTILKLSSGTTTPLTSNIYPDGHLIQDKTYFIGIRWDIPSTAPNAIQTDSFEADLLFEVQQYKNVVDFFTN